jgi:2-isopropylmalate synthase
MNPKQVGVNESSIVLTARSGRAALKHRLATLGYKLDQKELDEAYKEFLALADKKRDIHNDDLLALMGKAKSADRKIKLESLQVLCGKSAIPTATIRIRYEGQIWEGTDTGNGPIDAAINAVKTIITAKTTLEELLIHTITRGSDDMGKVHVQVESKGKVYYGFSANTDIITATVEAYLDALSQIV